MFRAASKIQTYALLGNFGARARARASAPAAQARRHWQQTGNLEKITDNRDDRDKRKGRERERE